MAITITPTLTGQRWGPKPCDLFDFWAHSTRETNGNPLLIYRHGGGGTSGTYQDDWTIDREPANIFDFLHSTAGLGLHFDVLSIETPQRSLGSAPTNGNRTLGISAVRELQRAIAEVKRLGVIGFDSTNGAGDHVNKINPHRVVGMGESWGAGAMMLSQFFPAYMGFGYGRTFSLAKYGGGSFDSTVAALIFNAGQPDVRTIASVDQVHYSQLGGYFGTNTTSGTEFTALPSSLKETMSCLAYLANSDPTGCPPTAVLYNIAGDATHPYGSGIGSSDVHDSQQGLDLAAALTAAGVRNLSMQYAVTNATTGWLNGSAGKVTNCTALYNFIASVLLAST